MTSRFVLSNGMLASVRVLMGDSVFESAQVTIRDGWLHIDFEDDDVDNVALDLTSLARPS